MRTHIHHPVKNSNNIDSMYHEVTCHKFSKDPSILIVEVFSTKMHETSFGNRVFYVDYYSDIVKLLSWDDIVEHVEVAPKFSSIKEIEKQYSNFIESNHSCFIEYNNFVDIYEKPLLIQ